MMIAPDVVEEKGSMKKGPISGHPPLRGDTKGSILTDSLAGSRVSGATILFDLTLVYIS